MTAPPPKRPRYSKRQVRVHIVGQSRPEYLDIIPSSFTPNIDPPVAKSQNNIPINTNSRSVGQLVDRGVPVSRSLSRKFYPDIPDDRLISILDQGKQRFVRNPPYVTFHATETTCADCGITLVPLAECKYTVLDVDSPAIVIVVDYRCNRCGNVYHYDGYDHALFRHKMCFYSYELLTDALDNLIDGVSCEQYYNRIMDRYFRLGYPVEVVKSWRNSVNIFKEVVYDFIRLTILPEKPCCAGDYIAAHEIETPVEAKLLEQFIHPWSPRPNARGVSCTTSLDGEFFSTSATRKLVQRYSISASDESKRRNREKLGNQCNQCHSGNVRPGLTSDEYDQLLCNLSENSEEGTLLPLFALFERQIDRLHGEGIQDEFQQMERQREDREEVRVENDENDGVNEAVETETEMDEEDDQVDEAEVQVDESGKAGTWRLKQIVCDISLLSPFVHSYDV